MFTSFAASMALFDCLQTQLSFGLRAAIVKRVNSNSIPTNVHFAIVLALFLVFLTQFVFLSLLRSITRAMRAMTSIYIPSESTGAAALKPIRSSVF